MTQPAAVWSQPVAPAGAAIGLAVVALLCGSCGRAVPARCALVARLIERDPSDTLRRTAYVDDRTIERWRFGSEADLAPWRWNVPERERALVGGGVRISPSRSYVVVERAVQLEAAAVDALEVRLTGLSRQPVFLEWSGPGRPYGRGRRIEVRLAQRDHDGSRRYRFVTAGHPGWSGAITAVRLSCIVPPGGEVALQGVDLLAQELSPRRLRAIAEAAWKVDLDGDLRNARLAIPGRPIRWVIDVPREARLSYSYGLGPRLGGPVQFRISVTDDRRRATLFAETVTQAGRWLEGESDLAAFAGRRIELELEAAGDAYRPLAGLAGWANVELLAPSSTARPNVVLVSIDTLRADHMSLYGYHRRTTPSIDRWARRAAVFERAVAAAPWTLPSHVSMLTGLDAHRHGVNHRRGAPRTLTMLAEILRSEGYATIAVTGGGYLHPQYGFAQGFDRYDAFAVGMGNDGELDHGLEEASKVLEKVAGRPFLLFFHTYEVHNPFAGRQPYLRDLTGRTEAPVVDVDTSPSGDRRSVRPTRRLVVRGDPRPGTLAPEEIQALAVDLYDSKIASTDAAVGRLFERLDALGVADDTVVVLTSDHGELFGEHGHVNHYTLFEENLHVPLVIASPRRRQDGLRVGQQVRSIDILPTILELVGLAPPDGLDGDSVVPALTAGGSISAGELAASYAAASSYGLALTRADGIRYTVLNDPWVAAGPARERLVGPAADGACELQLAGEAYRELRGRMARILAEEIAGVRIRIVNRSGDSPLVGRIFGSAISRPRVKATVIGRSDLEPVHGGRFRIQPGDSLEVIVVEAAGTTLELAIEAGAGRPAVSHRVEVDGLDGVLQLVPSGGGWLRRQADVPADDGVSVWWHHRPRAPGAEVDQSIQEQLHALGYAE